MSLTEMDPRAASRWTTTFSTADPSFAVRYLVSLSAVLGAVVLRVPLEPYLESRVAYTFMYLAVVVSAWFGGLRPGLVTVVLGGLTADFLYVSPVYSLFPRTVPGVAQFLIFTAVASAIVVLCESLRRSRAESERAAIRLGRLDEVVRVQSERYRVLVTDVREHAILFIDLDGRITDWNAGAAAILGWSRDEAIGKHFSLFFGDEDRHHHEPEHDLERARAADTGNERWYVRRDGTAFFGTGSLTALRGPDGSVSGFAKILRDDTARKRAEDAALEANQLMALAQSVSNSGAFWWQPATNRNVWAPELEALYGLSPNTFPGTYEAWLDLVDPRDRERVDAVVKTVSGSPDATVEFEFRVPQPDGSERWLAARTRMIIDPQGRPSRVVGINIDVTARRRFEEDRERLLVVEQEARQTAERAYALADIARAEAQQANRLKDDFLATVSHELRTPLNSILGWSTLLNRGPADADRLTEGLGVIERNARTQAQLIEDILDVSRMIDGRLRLELSPTDLAAAVRDAAETIRSTALAKGVTLGVEADDVGPVLGDAARLRQVLWNLLSNAVKFTPSGGAVRVTVQDGGSHARILVTDTGIGIAPDFLPDVFEPFRQADGSTTRRFGGLGLGLSIVRNLVEGHGGSVTVRSEGPNQGSTFAVELPFAQIVSSPEDAAHGARNERNRSLGGCRILVVDDDGDSRQLFRQILASRGALVTCTGSACDALALLQEGAAPDLVLCDIGMPDVDGYEFVARLRGPETRDDLRHLPVVALTAYPGVAARARVLEERFDGFLSKPVDPEQLITTVLSLLES